MEIFKIYIGQTSIELNSETFVHRQAGKRVHLSLSANKREVF